MDDILKKLARVEPSDRILLLPHCLRQSNTCHATYNKEGLQCISCNPDCSVNLLKEAAANAGYKAVCVAPGGRLAINFVRKNHPQAIVAVACDKELAEGVAGVNELAAEKELPLIAIVPLSKDGCVDTEVDLREALATIYLGCKEMAGKK